MPPISEYKCSKCSFSFPTGWGGYMYVTDDEGKRVICPHPGEMYTVRAVLGENASDELIEERVGYNTHCVCLTCMNQSDLDVDRDEMVCPICNSTKVKSIFELLGQPCPQCEEGIILEIDTGAMA